MTNTISRKISAKASADKHLVKSLPRDKSIGLEPEIKFYELEDRGKTEEGEEEEIIVIYDSRLAESKQNIVKRKLPYINTFVHEGPAVVSVMCNLTSRLFEHLDITSPMEVDQRIA